MVKLIHYNFEFGKFLRYFVVEFVKCCDTIAILLIIAFDIKNYNHTNMLYSKLYITFINN